MMDSDAHPRAQQANPLAIQTNQRTIQVYPMIIALFRPTGVPFSSFGVHNSMNG